MMLSTIRLSKSLLFVLACAITVVVSAVPAEAKSPTLLADAVEQRNSADVTRLLQEKADPDATQADGMTALIWAAYHDDLKIAAQLIHAGANVKAKNRYGVSALSLACVNGNGALVRLLLDKGADPNTTLNGGESVLMTAARTGRIEAVTALIKKGADVNHKEQSDQTALMWAAAEGHADVIDALISAGADFRTSLKSGFTPLAFAVRSGHLAATKRLLSAGANVNESMADARGGRNMPVKHTSPLLLAMENGHFELAAVLLQAGADPNDDRTGFAPLHAMSWIRKPEKGDNETGTPRPRGSGKLTGLDFVRKLVEHGADINIRKKSNGGGRLRISVKDTTPFLCAASTADVDYMKILLELGADAKHVNVNDQTALMMAAGIDEKPEGDGPGTAEEHLAAVKFMLELGADINAVDKNGETAMHGAAYKSLPTVVQLLSDRGADIKIWSQKTKQGRTPLSIAEGYRPGNFKPSFETVEAIKKVMIANGVTPPPPDKRGSSVKK